MRHFSKIQSEKIRIQHLIIKIKNIKEIRSVKNAIRIFETMFGASQTVQGLKLQLEIKSLII